MKDTNTFTVAGWMINKLNLKGLELVFFAIVWGFSQDGYSEYRGSIKYIMSWLSCSKPTAIKIKKSLVKKNFIVETEHETGNTFRANIEYIERLKGGKETLQGGGKEILPPPVKKFYPPCKETLPLGGKEILPNSNNYSNKDNNKDIDGEKKSSSSETEPPQEPITENQSTTETNEHSLFREKNPNEEKEKKKSSAKRKKEVGFNERTANAFLELFLSNYKRMGRSEGFISNLRKKHNLNKAANTVRLILKDGITENDLRKVYKYLAREDEFGENFDWRTNILSLSKLRKQLQSGNFLFTATSYKAKETKTEGVYTAVKVAG